MNNRRLKNFPLPFMGEGQGEGYKRIAIICFTVLTLQSCSFFYVAKQGAYQAKMLLGAKPIEIALRRTDLSKEQRYKLNYAVKVRKYGEKILGLNDNKNYTNVNIDWHNPIYNVSASKILSFTPYEWWFPIIGHVPYKGFFILDDALQEEKRLKVLGYETYRYEISGYSTLGYFSDPIWPSMLKLSDVSLCDLIIHELTHKAIYIPNETNFNETLANFVAQKATKRFFKENFNISLEEYYLRSEEREKFFHDLYVKLDSLYKDENILDEEKLKRKKVILNQAKKDFPYDIDFSEINNAYLMSFKRYNDNLPYFEALFKESGDDFIKFLERIKEEKGLK